MRPAALRQRLGKYYLLLNILALKLIHQLQLSNVPPLGEGADIDGIVLANGNIYKIVDGCTVTINPPGKTIGDLSIDCDSIKSRCGQILTGGEVEPWW